MKNFIYLSIAVASLLLTSCDNQQEMVQLKDANSSQASQTITTNHNSTAFGNFDSSQAEQGDPVKPPQD